MSSQNNFYGTPEDRANTAFDPSAELYRITRCLRKSRDYWATEIDSMPVSLGEYNVKFYGWLKEDYGLDVQFDGRYGLDPIVGYKIVDNQKFLMFMLKFQ
jgi:hypothetical protein